MWREGVVDMLNGVITACFQISLALIPFYIFLRDWTRAWIWAAILAALGALLYFTWYRNLPAPEET